MKICFYSCEEQRDKSETDYAEHRRCFKTTARQCHILTTFDQLCFEELLENELPFKLPRFRHRVAITLNTNGLIQSAILYSKYRCPKK